jgi:hypothetical protein
MKCIASKHAWRVSSLWLNKLWYLGVVRLNKDKVGDIFDVAEVLYDDKLSWLGERVMVLSMGVSNEEADAESHLMS